MMREPGGKTSRPWEPERYRHEAQSPAGKLPTGDVVCFLLETVPRLASPRFYAPYAEETRGALPFDPAMMVCLVLYAYCVGVLSSRQMALAGARHLAFMAIVGQERPDCRTISDFRTRHLEAFKDVLVQVVRLAAEAGLVTWGTVSTDGTQIQGHASRHQAMRYGSMKQEVERLREARAALVTQASQQDEADDAALGRRRGDALPAELARREERLARLEAAMRRLEAQAKAERQRMGKQRRGKAPTPVQESPEDKAQSHVTDPELHIMRTTTKGWESCGNAHARVDGACQSILVCAVTAASHDTQQAEPWAQATLATLPQAGLTRPKDESGAAQSIPATWENGYDSAAAVVALETCGCDPSIATGRQQHHVPQAEAPETPATGQERMAATVRTPAVQAVYARRKGIVAPVGGQSKAARGFRRFWLRGVATIRGAWRLVCLTHNRRKLWRYGRVLRAVYAVWRPVYGLEMALVRAPWRCGAAMALRREGHVKGHDPSGRAIGIPNQGSKSG